MSEEMSEEMSKRNQICIEMNPIIENKKRRLYCNYDLHLTEDEIQVIIGNMLGDATIFSHGQFKFSQKNIEYGFHVYNDLKRIFMNKPYLCKNQYGRIRVRMSSHHPIFDVLRQVWYPNGKKIVPSYVYKQIDKHAIAHLIMDDGCYNKHSDRIHICSQGFTFEENIKLCSTINGVLGTDARIIRWYDSSQKKNKWQIRFIKKDRLILRRDLMKYFTKGMKYKLRGDLVR